MAGRLIVRFRDLPRLRGDDPAGQTASDGRPAASPRAPSPAPAAPGHLGEGADPAPLGEAQAPRSRPPPGHARALPRRPPPRCRRPAAPCRPAARHSRAATATPPGPRRRRRRRHSRAPRSARPACSTGGSPSPAQPRSRSLRVEIGAQLGSRRRVAPGIGEREPLEPLPVERRHARLCGDDVRLHAMIVPQWSRIMNALAAIGSGSVQCRRRKCGDPGSLLSNEDSTRRD